jgi:hypothetical protein
MVEPFILHDSLYTQRAGPNTPTTGNPPARGRTTGFPTMRVLLAEAIPIGGTGRGKRLDRAKRSEQKLKGSDPPSGCGAQAPA